MSSSVQADSENTRSCVQNAVLAVSARREGCLPEVAAVFTRIGRPTVLGMNMRLMTLQCPSDDVGDRHESDEKAR
jgi:hypothetical protein